MGPRGVRVTGGVVSVALSEMEAVDEEAALVTIALDSSRAFRS